MLVMINVFIWIRINIMLMKTPSQIMHYFKTNLVPIKKVIVT